jgi:7,8-dihydro-6-hydroxymethylpterin dimethyltransferase
MPTSKVDCVCATAEVVWKLLRPINTVLPAGELPRPRWAPGPLLKRKQRTQMQTGVPRKTLSLCPDCNREAVEAFLRGERDVADFRDQPGIVEAEIVEEGSRILMRKSCQRHGPFEDTLSSHPDFFRKMEGLAFGKDFECVGDDHVHNHGPNSITSGRGSHLIVDLTNRCNMMCSPCFMDANAASYVHELSVEQVETLFRNAASFRPQREINVLFSGGEPTLSPIFFEALRHAKGKGFHRLHVATNGVRFAESQDFAAQAKAAGLHAVYLQWDGVTEEKNKHRGLGNYMEVKLKALENIAASGMRTTLQVTVVNGLNNDGVGEMVRFAVQNIDKIHGLLFQPVMFTGRDENIPTEDRYARRYPLSQLAYDLQQQSAFDWQPLRDWFPVSTYGIFAHLGDVLNPWAEVGSLFVDSHPDHGIFSPLLVDTQNKQVVPIPLFFNFEQFTRDLVEITDSARGPKATKALATLSLLRNFDSRKAPSSFGPEQFRGLLEDCFYRVAGNGDDWSEKAYSSRGRWRIMTSGAMWFQDAFNYDFAALTSASTPVATLEGEISFCAYNGGGWRKVMEHQSQTATLAQWYRTRGRHVIYAMGKNVDFAQTPHNPRAELVQMGSKD